MFVIDIHDKSRFESAKQELQRLTESKSCTIIHLPDNYSVDEELREVPFLVYANKMDLPNAITINELQETLRIEQVLSTWRSLLKQE